MKLKMVSIEELSKIKTEKDKIFVKIPFLYNPIIKELKKHENLLNKVKITVNRNKYSINEVILTFLRLFGIPIEINDQGSSFQIFFKNIEVFLELKNIRETIKGEFYTSEGKYVFSEKMSFINIIRDNDNNSIIALPEGDGFYYMDLDKKESEEEERSSIIGKPEVLIELNTWLENKNIG